MCQRFLCWLNSWMLLVKERRNCLTGLNLWASEPGWLRPAAGASAGAGYGPCHRPRPLCCRGEQKGRSSLLARCGIGFWPEAQAGHSQSIFACPAPAALNEREAPRRSSGKRSQSFPQLCVCLSLLQQPLPRSCDAAGDLWERLWKSYCCSCARRVIRWR